MLHFIIYTNAFKDKGLTFTEKVKLLLEKRGVKVTTLVTEAEQKEQLRSIRGDAMITLGGDGTILQAARDMGDNQMPLIGVNLGHLGFLTEINATAIEDAIDPLILGNYSVDRRMMLDGSFVIHDEAVCKTALNDIVLSRCGSLEIMCFHVYVNGQFFHEYLADGIICSTPTGSTGYNLSAGGPLIEPNARIITLTPVCPHSLNQRSILLSSEDEIEFRIPASKYGEEQTLEVSFDGQEKVSLKTGDALKISRSVRETDIIRINQDSFLEVLNRKLGENL